MVKIWTTKHDNKQMILTKTPCKYPNILLACLAYTVIKSIYVQGAELKTENAKPPSPITLQGEVDIIGSAFKSAGITISSTKLPSTITSVRLGSPAYYANLESQDKIVSAQIDASKISLTIERSSKIYSTQLNLNPMANIAKTALQSQVVANSLVPPPISYARYPLLYKARASETDIKIPEPAFALRAETFSLSDGRQGWVIKVGKDWLETPTYSSGILFLGGGFASHDFFALNANNGRLIWHVNTDKKDNGPSSAIIQGRLCAFNTQCCTVFAVDALTGAPIWQKWISDPLNTQPAEANGLLYIAYSAHNQREKQFGGKPGLLCLDLASGAERWNMSLSNEIISSPIVENGKVYATCADGNTACLDALTGQVFWTTFTGGQTAPLIVNRRVFHAGGESSTAEAQTPAIWRTVWGYDGGRPAYTRGLIIQVTGSTVEAINPLSGMIRWRTLLDVDFIRQLNQNDINDIPMLRAGTTNTATAHYAELDRLLQLNVFCGRSPLFSPAIGQQNIYLTSVDGHIISLRSDDGKVIFCYSTGQRFGSSPCLANGYLYVGTTDGKLISLYIGRDADGWTCWAATHSIIK